MFSRLTDPNWPAPSTSKSRGVWPILPEVLPPSVCRCSRPEDPVEGDGRVVDTEPVEVQVHGQEMKRAGAEDAEELVIRRGLVEPVLMDDRHRLGPEGDDGPVRDPDDRGAAIEGARDLREVARPDQPLGAEDQLLTTTAQRHARLLAERNHDVREAVQEVDLVNERRCPAPLEISVQRHRALPLGEHPEEGSHVEVSAQPEPREEVGVGLLGLRRAEQELPEVLPPRTGLPTKGQPHGPVRRQRDELQPVPEIIRRARVHPPQDRPVLVEPSG